MKAASADASSRIAPKLILQAPPAIATGIGPPEVLAEFKSKAADPAREAWIKDMEAQGIPGQELYDLVVKTLEEKRASN